MPKDARRSVPAREDGGRAKAILPPLVCAVGFAAAAILARAHGLSSVSDDDFARVAIAQTWALAPHLDPSGTSWLPFPFWVTGLAMMALGRTLEVARGVAVAEAAASGALLWAAGRRAGLGRASAAFGALVPLSIPLVRLLSAATVPELPTAALVTYAVLAARSSPWTAAVAVLSASLSRYEAWPAAAIVVAIALSPRRERDSALTRWAAAALAALGPAAWIGWNALAHGDPLRFAHRVAAYHAGLGVAASGAAYAVAAAREGGAILVFAAVATVALGRDGIRRFGVPLAAAAFLVLAPSLAALLGGAPTHHPERVVLPVFLLAAVAFAGAAPEAALLVPRVRPLSVVLACAALVIAQGALRVGATWASLGPSREPEIALGRALAAELPAGERFVLVPTSFAWLAIVAASGRPEDARALVSRAVDPRAKEREDPFASRTKLDEALAAEGARWVLTVGAQAAFLRDLGVVAIPLPGGALGRVR